MSNPAILISFCLFLIMLAKHLDTKSFGLNPLCFLWKNAVKIAALHPNIVVVDKWKNLCSYILLSLLKSSQKFKYAVGLQNQTPFKLKLLLLRLIVLTYINIALCSTNHSLLVKKMNYINYSQHLCFTRSPVKKTMSRWSMEEALVSPHRLQDTIYPNIRKTYTHRLFTCSYMKNCRIPCQSTPAI